MKMVRNTVIATALALGGCAAGGSAACSSESACGVATPEQAQAAPLEQTVAGEGWSVTLPQGFRLLVDPGHPTVSGGIRQELIAVSGGPGSPPISVAVSTVRLTSADGPEEEFGSSTVAAALVSGEVKVLDAQALTVNGAPGSVALLRPVGSEAMFTQLAVARSGLGHTLLCGGRVSVRRKVIAFCAPIIRSFRLNDSEH